MENNSQPSPFPPFPSHVSRVHIPSDSAQDEQVLDPRDSSSKEEDDAGPSNKKQNAAPSENEEEERPEVPEERPEAPKKDDEKPGTSKVCKNENSSPDKETQAKTSLKGESVDAPPRRQLLNCSVVLTAPDMAKNTNQMCSRPMSLPKRSLPTCGAPRPSRKVVGEPPRKRMPFPHTCYFTDKFECSVCDREGRGRSRHALS